MSDYTLKDEEGNSYSIRLGSGSKWPDDGNLAQCPIRGPLYLKRFNHSQLSNAVQHLYSGFGSNRLLKGLKQRTGSTQLPFSPHQTLGDALSHSELTLRKVGLGEQIEPELAKRAMLRVKIRNALHDIIIQQRQEARWLAAQMAQEGAATQGLIYAGGLSSGITRAAVGLGKDVWGLAVWLKDITDLINPIVHAQNIYRALHAGQQSSDFNDRFKATLVASEWRELVEVLGFNPSKLNLQQFEQAMVAAELIWSAPSLRNELTQFAKDYADAQHGIEYTVIAGAAVFELILTFILLALSGVGAVIYLASKLRHLDNFSKVGTLLLEFAKSSQPLTAKRKLIGSKGRTGQPASFDDFKQESSGSAARPVAPVKRELRQPKGSMAANDNSGRPLVKTSALSELRVVESLPNELLIDNRGVHGVLPKKGTQFHVDKFKIDWSDAGATGKARDIRLNYHQGMDKKFAKYNELKAKGRSDEYLARRFSYLRNKDRLSYYKTPEALDKIYKRNLTAHGGKLGPSYQKALQKYGSPQGVLDATFRPNNAYDLLTGTAKLKK